MSIWQSGTFYIGETWVISGYVRDTNGVIVDLTGATIQLRITLGNSVVFDLVGVISPPPTAGGYRFEITPDQQTDLAVTTYRYEVQGHACRWHRLRSERRRDYRHPLQVCELPGSGSNSRCRRRDSYYPS